MCGIAGYWDLQRRLADEDLRLSILGMTQSLRHRGPDSGGLWLDKSARIALGHRRLAIRDLSPLGNQPMLSPDGRLALVYNGEIYNVPELAASLKKEGLEPAGSSDTEIVLLCIMAWGVQETLRKIMGMFALAVWDGQEKALYLARDRFGVKPLYWSASDGALIFASEPDAFFQARGWKPQIDYDAVALYLRFGYIPAPYSIWRGVSKMPEAHCLRVDRHGRSLIEYWSAFDIARAGLAEPFAISEASENEIVNRLDDLLTDAVRRRMVADVPLGAFLSGGIDSSVVAALMQKCSSRPVRTFCIGFEEEKYNEAPYAAAVAAHIGSCHTEMYVPASEAWGIIPDLAEVYDEPFGDASAVPTTLLSRLTRRYVTTALSGDGGDEIFAGYDRYARALENAPVFPGGNFFKTLAASACKILPPHTWDVLCSSLPAGIRAANAGSRIHNYAELRLTGDFRSYYQRYHMQYWWHPDTVLKNGRPPSTVADAADLRAFEGHNLAFMQFVDTQMYLANDILTKVDMASMSCSLETRVPLLDHRLFAFAWRIPESWRQKGKQGKYLLRKVLERYVPAKLVDRPKMGFGIPIAEWLAGPLRNWAESLLAPQKLEREGIFRVPAVRRAWERQINGPGGWEYHLWVVLMLQAWLERPRPERTAVESLAFLEN